MRDGGARGWEPGRDDPGRRGCVISQGGPNQKNADHITLVSGIDDESPPRSRRGFLFFYWIVDKATPKVPDRRGVKERITNHIAMR